MTSSQQTYSCQDLKNERTAHETNNGRSDFQSVCIEVFFVMDTIFQIRFFPVG